MLRTSLVGGAVILALAACATTPPTPMTAAAQAKPPLGCVSDTATRLPVNPNECAGVGSTYTKKDAGPDRAGVPAGRAARPGSRGQGVRPVGFRRERCH